MRKNVHTALIQAALDVREHAYAKYSQFLVGAALLTVDGRTFVGCNVENVSYGLTNCAERSAVFAAIAAGQREFSLLAIASAGGVTPCGACRQVLMEFAPELPILLVDVNQPATIVEVNLNDLLPGAFTFAQEPDKPDQSKRKSPQRKRSENRGQKSDKGSPSDL
jgi:cytidine deaminase